MYRYIYAMINRCSRSLWHILTMNISETIKNIKTHLVNSESVLSQFLHGMFNVSIIGHTTHIKPIVQFNSCQTRPSIALSMVATASVIFAFSSSRSHTTQFLIVGFVKRLVYVPPIPRYMYEL